MALTSVALALVAALVFSGSAAASQTGLLGTRVKAQVHHKTKHHKKKHKKHHKKKHHKTKKRVVGKRGKPGATGPQGPAGLPGIQGIQGLQGPPGPGAQKVMYDSAPIAGDSLHSVGSIGPYQFSASCQPGSSGGAQLTLSETLTSSVFLVGTAELAMNTNSPTATTVVLAGAVPAATITPAPIKADAGNFSVEVNQAAIHVSGSDTPLFTTIYAGVVGTAGAERCALIGWAV